jgi:hypothetical protein
LQDLDHQADLAADVAGEAHRAVQWIAPGAWRSPGAVSTSVSVSASMRAIVRSLDGKTYRRPRPRNGPIMKVRAWLVACAASPLYVTVRSWMPNLGLAATEQLADAPAAKAATPTPAR